jgi:hypothetical protein
MLALFVAKACVSNNGRSDPPAIISWSETPRAKVTFLMFRFAREKKLKNRLTVYIYGPGFVPRLSCFSHVCIDLILLISETWHLKDLAGIQKDEGYDDAWFRDGWLVIRINSRSPLASLASCASSKLKHSYCSGHGVWNLRAFLFQPVIEKGKLGDN